MRRVFKLELKREVVRQVMQPGNTIAAFSRDLGLHESLLRRWIKELGSEPEKSLQALPASDEQIRELGRLRMQVDRQRMAREAVVHALGSFAASPRMDSAQPALPSTAEAHHNR